jgi:demethylmenaquinone methyltransferase/2-methoxy-6-polyprenyl-1,4-benzoquinol methylase
MKSGGFLNILEFSKVQDQIFSKIYDFYSFNVIPKIGKLISNDSDSYEYLVESIRTHEDQESLRKMILDSGFDKANFENLFNGIVSIHKAQK